MDEVEVLALYLHVTQVVILEMDLTKGSGKSSMQQFRKADPWHQKSGTQSRRRELAESQSPNVLSTGQSGNCILDQQPPPTEDKSTAPVLPASSAPICRQFWKAGNYDEGLTSKSVIQNGSSYLHIHPKFLHSNATSHKWAFGAIAELLDNAVDEVQNGATLVIVDRISNPKDGNPALLIQDDGGGMDPKTMRHCLSFGFSAKKSKSAIGQYGNGFKTSSMRLGADVIVFSRCLKERTLMQSIGLLSYTFLTQTGHDRIVVPMLDYVRNATTGTWETLHQFGEGHFMSNLSMLLQWSPYSTEAELLKQLDAIGNHGTRIIIYNLWLKDDGSLELDFNSDLEDICLSGDAKLEDKGVNRMAINESHMANRYQYSLRVYLSILYLQRPESFSIVLRGRVVEYHNIAADLKFPEFILYKPQSGGYVEGKVVTAIGFLKEAPHVNIHGFNVYHKNRLILPFWKVVSYSDSRGRGVVGVLEANFIEPTHNKQDFEKTSVFQKLENRLKEMTWDYWDTHCRLLGYRVTKKSRATTTSVESASGQPSNIKQQPVMNNKVILTTLREAEGVALRYPLPASSNCIEGSPRESLSNSQGNHGQEQLKRKVAHHITEPENMKRRAGGVDVPTNQEIQVEDQEVKNLLQENKRLREQCLENEKRVEKLNLKVKLLRTEIEDADQEYARLLAELQLLDKSKDEPNDAP
ncbi:protein MICRORCHIDIA 6-like isoform X2 [Diospyros lotus]|uniref:protein MICRORCHIDIA 6-like isoform X2 n=1 Tax=Diospyros lotus TaxID=55363 RepID=UPI00225A85CC|nr:protein MICRORCHIDIA 6-like isoform X2 [Diospyros lotus]